MKDKGAIITGILAGVLASSCCIAPAVAFIAGLGGAASAFSWIEPLRPYLIGLSIAAIGYAWYNYFKTSKNACCSTKPKWYQTKTFLIIITIFAALSIAFPYYYHIFYPKSETTITKIDENNIYKVELKIQGMTCKGCEEHISYALQNLDGVIKTSVSYQKGNAIVEFDKTKISQNDIIKAVDSTGYKVINTKTL